MIEPETVSGAEMSPEVPLIDMHAMDPVKVLRLVAAMGGRLERLLIAVGLIAAIMPARHAARVHPVEALRAE